MGGTIVGLVGVVKGAALELEAFFDGRFGKGDLEAGFGEAEVFDLEGDGFSIPGNPLESEGGGSDTAPSATGLPDPKGAAGAEGEPDAAGLEVLDEIDDGALVNAVDFLESDAEDVGAGLVAHEHIAFEGAEFALGEIDDGVARTIGNFSVGNPDGRRCPNFSIFFHGDFVEVFAFEIRVVSQGSGVSVEGIRGKVEECGGGDEVTLIVGIKNLVGAGVEDESCGRAKPPGEGGVGAIG